MGTAQTQKVEKDLHILLPNNPFVPPQGDVCFANSLPAELLARIFEDGVADDGNKDEDEMGNYWANLRYSLLGEEDTDDEDPDVDSSDVEMADERGDADAGVGDEEEIRLGVDETVSDATGSSDFPPPLPPFQVVVSHACRNWRHVALSTPSLWTTIRVTSQMCPPYEPISMLLERSQDLPIDISINSEPEYDIIPADDCAPSEEDLRFLYNYLLTPHVHRWRSIEVTADDDYDHMSEFLSAVSRPSISAAPQLTALQLYHHEETEEFSHSRHPSASMYLVLFGGSAPCLSNVVLWGVHVDWDQPWIASASKLKDLELAHYAENVRPTWTQFVTILRGASSLEKLNLRMSGPSGNPLEWLTEPVQFPKVTVLVLAFHSPERAIGLLHKFVLPALKHLVLDFDNYDYTDFVHVLVGLATSFSLPSAQKQSRSLLSNLESLKLAGLQCSSGCAAALYGELQNLTSLNISLSYLSHEFIDLIYAPCTLDGRNGLWLPRLTTLYVSGTSGDVLRNIVGKRRIAGVPLESLYVRESCTMNSKDLKWLKENLKTFELFEGSDEEYVGFEDLQEDVNEWANMD